MFLRLSPERQQILLIEEFRAGSAQDGDDVHIADARGDINALDHVDELEGFGAYQVTGLSETTT